MAQTYHEWQFDGLVGPTHNYAGLATGNLAAAKNAGAVSNPRAAALQGLEKMRFVRNLGVKQAFFPPAYRPVVPELERLGFRGSRAEILDAAAEKMPGMLASVYSSSFMWAANAATVTPSYLSGDLKLNLTPANLVNHFHRALEAESTLFLLKSIFHNKNHHSVHNFLFHCEQMGDEGAANHMLVSSKNNDLSLNMFIYGESHQSQFNARQRRFASETIAHLHGLKPENCFFLQQSPSAINLGVFHNDVIAMSAGRLAIAHAGAYVGEHQALLQELSKKHGWLIYREVTAEELSIEEAVATYLFNSQLLEVEKDIYTLVAPVECYESVYTRRLIEKFLEEKLIHEVRYINVRESMRNGGGPACLRLRVPMTDAESDAMHPGIVLTDVRYEQLREWVSTHYRDRLCFNDLRDPRLIDELNAAYVALEDLIHMPGLYTRYGHTA